MSVTPEQLAAYADGELDDTAALAVERAVALDSELQNQLAAHRALKARLSAHFAPIVEQPVPEHLTRLLQESPRVEAGTGNVVDLAEARNRRLARPSRKWVRFLGPAVAASLVLLVVGMEMRPSAHYAEGPLALALDKQLAANQTGNEPVRILISFRNREGAFCRGYSGGSASGIACREAGGWKIIQQFGGGGSASTEYRQAGSSAGQVFAAAQDMASGAALDEPAERAAQSVGWMHR